MNPKTRNKITSLILFVLYLCFLSYLLFFSETFGRTASSSQNHSVNLVLFHEIRRYLVNYSTLGMISAINLIGNVVAFMPFGFFCPLLGKHRHSFFRTVLLGALFSLGVETVQYFSNVGSFDVDDIFLNTLGTVLGYLMYELVVNMILSRGENRLTGYFRRGWRLKNPFKRERNILEDARFKYPEEEGNGSKGALVSYVKKPYAKNSFFALFLTIIALGLTFGAYQAVIYVQGAPSTQVSAFALSSFLFAGAGLIYGLSSLRQGGSRKFFSILACLVGGILSLMWILIFVL